MTVTMPSMCGIRKKAAKSDIYKRNTCGVQKIMKIGPQFSGKWRQLKESHIIGMFEENDRIFE